MRRAAVALVLALSLTGCIGAHSVLVVASAPKASDGMTIFVVTDRTLLPQVGTSQATYSVYYGDSLVYPPGGQGGAFPVNGRSGSEFLPYNRFVQGNGDYDIVVEEAGVEARTRVNIQKWASYVWLHPFSQDGQVVVEVALESASGGHPEDRILAGGEILLTLTYHGTDGASTRSVTQIAAQTRHDNTSTDVQVATARFTAGPGWYSFDPIFSNDEAVNNLQVPGDPVMANTQPPYNWIYIT